MLFAVERLSERSEDWPTNGMDKTPSCNKKIYHELSDKLQLTKSALTKFYVNALSVNDIELF